MSKEAIKLRETIAARLTTKERNKLSTFVKKFNTTKSELIRALILDFLKAKQKQIINK